MKLKYLSVILCQIAVLNCWGQTIDDILEKKEPELELEMEMEMEEMITMPVDKDLYSGKTQAEQEKEKQDSIAKVDEKWKTYLLEKNAEIEQLFTRIQQIDSKKITKDNRDAYKDTIDKYKSQAKNFKKQVDDKIARSRWQHDNDELDKMSYLFDETYEQIEIKLRNLEDILKKEPLNKLLVWGIALLAVMAVVPVFTQIKSGIMMRKVKKQQEQQTKKQQEEMEKQMLLMEDSNIITLKE